MTDEYQDAGTESLNEMPNSEEVADNVEETTENQPEESVESLQERLAKAEELANNYKVRAEKAEQRAKSGKADETQDAGNAPKGLSAEEGKVYAKLYTDKDMPEDIADEAVEIISKVASLEGTTLTQAMDSFMYKSWRKTKIQEHKDQRAALGASRGSSPEPRKNLDSRGLSKDEHKALWKEYNS